MADKKSYRNIQLRNRTKRQQLITPTTSLSSLFSGSTTSINAASSTTGQSKKNKMGKKVEKEKQPKERWLLTRKTWKYMTDAGRRLIPDYIQNRTTATTDSQDLKKIEEYFQHVCRSEPRFLPWRRKQSYPGAMGTSAFRRSGKLRYTNKWFGRSIGGLAPISDNKSSGSSNFSSPPTKLNSADESEDEGYSAYESQRMFLIIEMLEKYLKLSSTTSPLDIDNLADVDNANLEANEGSSSPNEFNSSATISPVRSNMSPDNDDCQSKGIDDLNAIKSRVSPPPYQGYRAGDTENRSSSSRRRFLYDSTTSAPRSINQSHFTSSGSYANSSRKDAASVNRSQHTSLLLENLRNYGRSNRSSLLSTMNFTPAVLEDKKLLRRIRDELKQQQLDSILRRHSRRPLSADTSGLRLSTSLFMLPTLKTTPQHNFSDRIEGSGQQQPSIEPSKSDLNESSAIAAASQTDAYTSPSQSPRIPLISIKFASQERSPHACTEGTQTDPIPVNHIYQQYYEYMKRQEEKQAEQSKAPNALSKSISVGGKTVLGVSETTKHSKRKSSIDNEDVSQSVSDTIKRYLRMARKKTTGDNDANRFKRINYDTNLRNITSKAEIPKPDDLLLTDGSSKSTQTNDNWCEIVIREIKMHMSSKDMPISSFPIDYHRDGAFSSDEKTSTSPPPFTTSASTPTSPTGFFHTSYRTKDSIFGHKKDEGNTNKFNMQKSKSSTNVGQVFSKKIWKSRSKSQTRPDSPAQPHWTPQGNCVWKSSNGKCLQLRKTHLRELTEVERKSLHRIALDRINQLNIGVAIKLPPDTTTNDGLQPKSQKRRAPLLLKRKALTTGFFDSSKIKSDGRKGSTSTATSGGGLIFGQPLEKCLSNDNALGSASKSKISDYSGSNKFSRKSRSSITSLDNQILIGSGISSDGTYAGSCDSLFSKNDLRFIGSNSGDSLSDTGGYGNNLDDEDANVKSANGNIQPQVPPLILACIDHLSLYGLNVVGIFRVSTSKRRIRELREELDCGSLTSFDAETSPHDVASLLKEYLRDLPEPLLCRSLYPAFLSTQKIRNRRLQLEALSHLIQLLPIAHRDTLYVLLKFLAHVARCSDDVMNLATNTCISVGNKMDSANLATVIAPNILHSNTDATGHVATDEQAEERLDVINVVRTMIDHYEELFAVPADVMDDVYTVMMDTFPQQLDYIFDRKESYDVNSRKDDNDRDSSVSSKSPGAAQLHTHFFPQQTQERFDYNDIIADETDQPRRMYVREQFTHENTVRGNVAEPVDGSIKRRERGSRNKSLIPEHDVFSRRRRREKLPSSSSNNSSPSADDAVSYNYATLNVSPPMTPTHKTTPEYKSSSNEVLMASLKLPVQMISTSAIHADITTTASPLNLSTDLSDIPYIEEGDVNNGFRANTNPTSYPQSSASLRLSKGVSQANQLVKKCAFPLTKLKSQYKPTQLTLSAVPTTKQTPIDQPSSMHAQDKHFDSEQLTTAIDSKTKKNQTNRYLSETRRDSGPTSLEKSVSQPILPASNAMIKPRTVETAQVYSTEPKLTASITSIGGDVMRSKTAEFERMLMQQNKQASKSNSIENSSSAALAAHKRDSKISGGAGSLTSQQNHSNRASSDNLQSMMSSGGIRDSSGSGLRGSTKTDSANVRNGPIYKRRDVISSALNLKK